MATVLKADWALTKRAFDRLLRRLDPDRERAGERYELLRRKLDRFFECRGYPFVDEAVDETINRVARRLDEGTEIRAVDPALYFYGVARLVLAELRLQLLRVAPADVERLREPLVSAVDAESAAAGVRLDCIERCLEHLPSDQRQLILEYYPSDGREKILRRQDLARQLGVPLNALRIRACRIRARLESCAEACAAKRNAASATTPRKDRGTT